MANEIGNSYGLPAGLMATILRHESGGKPWVFNIGAKRESTAVGLGQLVYTTARGLNTYHTFHAVENLKAICDLMKRNLNKANGDLKLALVYYGGNPQTTLHDYYLKYKDTPQYYA
jgi:hypothetical protein